MLLLHDSKAFFLTASPYLFAKLSKAFFPIASISACFCLIVVFTGCGWQELLDQSTALNGTPFAYRKSVAELNQKAADLLQQGDAAGAVSRLEAARDLAPNDAGILYNLAIATSNWAGSQPEKTPQAIGLLEQFIEKNPNDGRFLKAVQSLAVLYEREANRIGGQLDPENALSEDGTKTPTLTPSQQAELKAQQLSCIQKALRCYETLKERGDTNPAIPESMVLLQKTANTLSNPSLVRQGKAS